MVASWEWDIIWGFLPGRMIAGSDESGCRQPAKVSNLSILVGICVVSSIGVSISMIFERLWCYSFVPDSIEMYN